MMNVPRLLTCLALSCVAGICIGTQRSDTDTTYTAFVPMPVKAKLTGSSAFYLTPNIKVVAEDDGSSFAATQLDGWLKALQINAAPRHTELRADAALSTASPRSITFRMSPTDLGPEGYDIKVTFRGVVIRASAPAGFYYGAQTFRQMLPAMAADVPENPLRVPGIDIQDAPRYAWRGLMVDCCRHFVAFDELKKIIDVMASQKLNVFHWHLTNDQAWRLEIKKYPELTEKGAWREGTGFNLPTTSTIHYRESDSKYGGFYTQEQARELVRYAADRGITIVPEFEIPGHATAAIHTYPQLGCTGKPVEMPLKAGVFPEIFCAGNEEAMSRMKIR